MNYKFCGVVGCNNRSFKIIEFLIDILLFFQMADQTQNIENDNIEIKEELIVDFSESDNQNENVINDHQNNIILSDSSENSSHHLKIDPTKVETDNSNSNSESISEDQNSSLNHIEIKEENINDNECQIHDPLQLQQQQQTQKQLQQIQQPQRVELRVSDNKINGEFCISWLRNNYELMKGSTIGQQDMYTHYLTSLHKELSKKDVVSSDNFSNCVR